MRTLPPIRHFLLVFDHDQDRLVEQIDFDGDIERALKVYGEREEELNKLPRDRRPRIEIVLIGSDSVETIKHDSCEVLRRLGRRVEVLRGRWPPVTPAATPLRTSVRYTPTHGG